MWPSRCRISKRRSVSPRAWPKSVPAADRTRVTVFIELPNTKIEFCILGEDSPINGFLEKNPAGGIHHICYGSRTSSPRGTIESTGARVPTASPRSAPMAAGALPHPQGPQRPLVELEGLNMGVVSPRPLRHLVDDLRGAADPGADARISAPSFQTLRRARDHHLGRRRLDDRGGRRALGIAATVICWLDHGRGIEGWLSAPEARGTDG